MIRHLLLIAAALLVSLAGTSTSVGQDHDRDQPDRKGALRRGAPPTMLKLYEWGVETRRWDGGSEAGVVPDDVPEHCYDATKLPLQAAPQPLRPVRPNPNGNGNGGPARPRKPVIYFECDKDITFDIDVRIAAGQLTWVYPKPNRMTSRSEAQWDNVLLVQRKSAWWMTEEKKPELPAVAADHWANYSRQGSDASIVVNNEIEHYLFYEAENHALPELDIRRDDDGLIIRNYSSRPVHDVRYHQPGNGDTIDAWYIQEIAAGNDMRPTEIRLTADSRVSFERFSAAGTLATECKAAGLTEPQAKVFDRAWRELFFRTAEPTLSWRRSNAQLDALMPLSVTVPANTTTQLKRVGYVYVHGIETHRQSEFDNLALLAIGKNADAMKQVREGGMAAISALREVARNPEMDGALRKQAMLLLQMIAAGK